MEPASFCNDLTIHAREQSVMFEFWFQEPKTADDPTLKERVLIKSIAMEMALFRQAICPMAAKLCGPTQLPPSLPDEPPIRR